jgi:hypothetical protein
MTDNSTRQQVVDDDGEVSFSDQLAEFVSTVSSALDSADGVDDDDVEAVERAGEELVERAEEEPEEDTTDQLDEDADGARVDWDGKDHTDIEVVDGDGSRYPIGRVLDGRALESDLEAVEARVDEVEADLEAVDDDASPNGQTPETGLEQLARLPDQLLGDESANVRRSVALAETWRDHASKAPVGFVLSSGELAQVLRDETDCRGHSQTASRVIDRLDQLGGDGVSVVERRGERRVAFEPELVGRLEAMSEQSSPAVDEDSGHGVVSDGIV